MSKKKFSFDIITNSDGKVRLENVQHKKVSPKLADALNKAIGEVVRDYNLTQKVCRVYCVNKVFTSRDETRRLIALGLNPKTRDITLVYGSRVRGAFFMMEGYRTAEEFRMCSGKIPRIERRWSRELLDSMLTPYEERGRLYVPRTVETSVSEIEERINDGTFDRGYLKKR